MEDFKINEKFAEQYKRYRTKEQYQKLKDRYGDIKIRKDKKNEESEESDFNSVHSDSSSCDSDGSSLAFNDWQEKDHIDFLKLVDAIDNNDPSYHNNDKEWFQNPPESDSEQDSANTHEHIPVRLKDHERENLLKDGVLEEDDLIEQGEKVSKMDSDLILQKLKSDENAKLDVESFNMQADIVEKRNNLKKVNEKNKYESSKIEVPNFRTDMWKLSATGKTEDEAFLRDFFLNKKWLKSSTISKIIPKQKKQLTVEEKGGVDDKIFSNTLGSDHSNLNDEDDWLIRKKPTEASEEVEISQSESDSSEKIEEFKRNLTMHDSEEQVEKLDSHLMLKTYPRKITDTLRQVQTKSRSEKRKEAKAKRAEIKRQKLEDLYQLHKLKLEQFEEQIKKIKKRSGFDEKFDKTNDDAEQVEKNIDIELVEHLDEDEWDPDAHEKLMSKLFNEQYYAKEVAEEEKPNDSEIEDLKSDMSEEELDKFDVESNCDQLEIEGSGTEDEISNLHGKSRRRRKRRRTKGSKLMQAVMTSKPKYDPDIYPDFDEYFDKFYKIKCDDIINCHNKEKDILCRFSYRSVKPNNFGLTTEEILAADDAELNQWVSIKKMSQYRENEEEDRDLNYFNGPKRQSKKNQILKSLYIEENIGDDDDDLNKYENKHKRKRRDKNKKEKRFSDLKEISDADLDVDKSSKKCTTTDQRFMAAGLTAKEIKKLKYIKNK